MTESKMIVGDDKAVRPWPWTVNSPMGPRRFDTKDEAVAYIQYLVERQRLENIDVGMLQVNLRWHGHRTGGNVADLIDPRTNIRVAAQILSEELRRSNNDLHIAVGRYHSPNDRTRAAQYTATWVRQTARLRELYP